MTRWAYCFMFLVVVVGSGCPTEYYDDDDSGTDDELVSFTAMFTNQTGYYLDEGSATFEGSLVGGFAFWDLDDGETVSAEPSTVYAVVGSQFTIEGEATDIDGCTYEWPNQAYVVTGGDIIMEMIFVLDHWTGDCF